MDDNNKNTSTLLAKLEAMQKRGREKSRVVDVQLAGPDKPEKSRADRVHFLENDFDAQGDMFIADLMGMALKNDMASMEAPIYSLSTKIDMDIWRWRSADKKSTVEVIPSAFGRATMNDKDILIYIGSQLLQFMREAEQNGTPMPGRRVRFSPSQFFAATHRTRVGKSGYDRLLESLDRLDGTRIKTNMYALVNGEPQEQLQSFGLIDDYKIVYEANRKGVKKMKYIEVSISQWMYNSYLNKAILTMHPEYFTLRKPLEKRIYEVARKHVGTNQPKFEMLETAFQEKCLSTAQPNEFRRMLREIIADDNIPGYRIALIDEGTARKVILYQKDPKKLMELEAKINKKPKEKKIEKPHSRQQKLC